MRFKHVALIALCWLASCGSQNDFVFAQEKAPAAVVAPVLSMTEKLAIGTLIEKLQANAKERENLLSLARQIENEIVKEHPGYHFDEGSGTIAKDSPERKALKPAK